MHWCDPMMAMLATGINIPNKHIKDNILLTKTNQSSITAPNKLIKARVINVICIRTHTHTNRDMPTHLLLWGCSVAPATLPNCIGQDITRQSIVTDYQLVIELQQLHISTLNYALHQEGLPACGCLWFLLLLPRLCAQVLIALARGSACQFIASCCCCSRCSISCCCRRRQRVANY